MLQEAGRLRRAHGLHGHIHLLESRAQKMEACRRFQAHGGSASAALKGEKEEAEEKAAAKEREKREKEKPVPPWTAASDDDKITLSVHDLKLTKAGQAAVNKQVRSLLR